jgi:hypothetical protein
MTDPQTGKLGRPEPVIPQRENRPHFAVQVTDLPPTEIVCNCGARFVGGDVIAKQKAHMEAEQTDRPGAPGG